MGIRIAICQIAGTSDPEENLKRIEGAIMQNQADLYVFPELYLTGYGNSEFDPEDTVIAENRLRIICNNMDVAVAVGEYHFVGAVQSAASRDLPLRQDVHRELPSL